MEAPNRSKLFNKDNPNTPNPAAQPPPPHPLPCTLQEEKFGEGCAELKQPIASQPIYKILARQIMNFQKKVVKLLLKNVQAINIGRKKTQRSTVLFIYFIIKPSYEKGEE